MAKAISRSNCHNQALQAVVIFGLVLLIQIVSAAKYEAGGADGWRLPCNGSEINYNQWAKKHRFQVGDSILFVYQPDKDSVLQVTNDDFVSCNPSAPIASFNDGHTSFKFSHCGRYYFISGIKDNCLKNEKMVVIVMEDRNNQTSTKHLNPTASPPPINTTVSPPPINTTVSPPPINTTVSPPPLSSTPPSPLPYSSPPSPPPSGATFGPIPAPTGEGTPSSSAPCPSGASYTLVSLISCVGAFVGSSFLLTL